MRAEPIGPSPLPRIDSPAIAPWHAGWNLAFAAYILLVLGVIASGLRRQQVADDFFFAHVLDHNTLPVYLLERWREWTGRIVVEAVMVGTIRQTAFWKTVVPACLLLSAFSIWRLGLRAVLPWLPGTALVLALLLFVPEPVAQDAAWWLSGFYNYLMPASLGLYAFSVLRHPAECGRPEKLLALASLLIAGNTEQVSLCLVLAGGGLAMLRWRVGRLSRFDMLFVGVALLSFWVLVTAPGNFNRSLAETRTWMPEYAGYGLLQKLSLGFDRVHGHVVDVINLPFHALCALVAVQVWRGRSPLRPVVLLVLGAHLLLVLLRARYGAGFLPGFYLNGNLAPGNWSSGRTFVSHAAVLVVLGTLWFALVGLGRDERERIALGATFLLALMCTSILGFSPTVYASNQRILFATTVLVITLICVLLGRVRMNQARDLPLALLGFGALSVSYNLHPWSLR